MLVAGSVTALGRSIWNTETVVVTRRLQSTLTPASYCRDLYGAKTSPAFSVPAGATPPRVRPAV